MLGEDQVEGRKIVFDYGPMCCSFKTCHSIANTGNEKGNYVTKGLRNECSFHGNESMSITFNKKSAHETIQPVCSFDATLVGTKDADQKASVRAKSVICVKTGT